MSRELRSPVCPLAGPAAAVGVVAWACCLAAAPARSPQPAGGAAPQAPQDISWAKVSSAQRTAATALGVPVAFENSVGMRFVLIPAGSFLMGSRDPAAEVARRCAMPNAQPGWFFDEHPRHEVTLTGAFYLAVHETTRRAWQRVLAPKKPKHAGKQKPAGQQADQPEDPNLPVVGIRWADAERFCKSLGSREGRNYFLPTEAQWEYACRGGTQTPFAFGETLSTDRANYNGNYPYHPGSRGAYRARPMPVGSFPPNGWGLYEMHGNVSEWCSDRYAPYPSGPRTDPTGPEKGEPHVLRGGSWRSYGGACRSAFRSRTDGPADHIGFRVACALTAEAAKKNNK